MVKLPSNLLDSLAEKLFKMHEEGLNKNGMDSIFNYMLCSRDCKDSVLRQFGEMKKIEFGRAVSADFYRESTQKSEDEDQLDRPTPVPYSVDGRFVGYLMQHNSFRVKHIVFPSYVVEKMGSRGMLPAKELNEMGVIDILSELVGLEEKNPGVSRCQESDLQLDCVEVHIAGASTQEGLNRFIALAPKKLIIRLENEVPSKSEGVSERLFELSLRVRFPEIKTVRVEVQDVKENEAAWPTFLLFLTESCPKCFLDVSCTLYALYALGLPGWIQKVAESLQNEIFPKLMQVCDADVVVNFEMRSLLSQREIEVLQSGHPVLHLGEPVHKPPFVLSRSIAVEREKEGEQQAPWTISFHIEAYTDDDSGDDDSGDDDSGDDDSGDDDSGDDDSGDDDSGDDDSGDDDSGDDDSGDDDSGDDDSGDDYDCFDED